MRATRKHLLHKENAAVCLHNSLPSIRQLSRYMLLLP